MYRLRKAVAATSGGYQARVDDDPINLHIGAAVFEETPQS